MAKQQINLDRAARRRDRTAGLYDSASQASQPASRQADRRESAHAGKHIKKATFRLHTNLIDQIDDVYLECRQLAKKAKRPPVTKDQIVNAVVEFVIEDPEKMEKLKKRLSA